MKTIDEDLTKIHHSTGRCPTSRHPVEEVGRDRCSRGCIIVRRDDDLQSSHGKIEQPSDAREERLRANMTRYGCRIAPVGDDCEQRAALGIDRTIRPEVADLPVKQETIGGLKAKSDPAEQAITLLTDWSDRPSCER